MTFFPRSARPKVLRRGDCKIAAADVAVVAAISLDPPAVFAAVKVTSSFVLKEDLVLYMYVILHWTLTCVVKRLTCARAGLRFLSAHAPDTRITVRCVTACQRSKQLPVDDVTGLV